MFVRTNIGENPVYQDFDAESKFDTAAYSFKSVMRQGNDFYDIFGRKIKPAYNTLIESPVPFYDDRTSEISKLIIHCSWGSQAGDLIDAFSRNEVSAHYIIDVDGVIIQCVSERKRGFHAGESYWGKDGGPAGNRKNLNDDSIGIEMCSQTMGQTPYTEKQFSSLKWLAASIAWRHRIKPYNITGHSDVAARRKADPGKMLNWEKLAEIGVGYWYNLNDAERMKGVSTRQALGIIGYNVRTEEDAAASTYAFLRHFCPDRVAVPANVRDVIKNVYPRDEQTRQELFRDKNIQQIAQAVAAQVIRIRMQEKNITLQVRQEHAGRIARQRIFDMQKCRS